jgi:hypothetical protein
LVLTLQQIGDNFFLNMNPVLFDGMSLLLTLACSWWPHIQVTAHHVNTEQKQSYRNRANMKKDQQNSCRSLIRVVFGFKLVEIFSAKTGEAKFLIPGWGRSWQMVVVPARHASLCSLHDGPVLQSHARFDYIRPVRE